MASPFDVPFANSSIEAKAMGGVGEGTVRTLEGSVPLKATPLPTPE